MNRWTADFWRQALLHDRDTFMVPANMYRHQDLISPETPISSGNGTGIPTSPSVYGRVRSWLLQGQGNSPPEQYHGLSIHKKVTNPLK
jgi:hypothetical protein